MGKEMKQTLYFAVYINVGTASKVRRNQKLSEFISMYKQHKPHLDQYIEKFYWFPIETGETRMELLYPSPFVSNEHLEELYIKHQAAIAKLGEEINKEK